MREMNSDFWHEKNVLVTGHTGFKGGWLSLLLNSLGATVFGFSAPPKTSPCLFEEVQLSDRIASYIGDVRDFSKLTETIDHCKPDIVFHLAAQPLVITSYEDPIETYSTNVMGTVNLLQALKACGTVKSIVNITSDKCYENNEWPWGYRETDPMGGHDPYSSSKGCSELITSAYRRSFFADVGVGLATARAGNIIGGGDWSPYRLIPDVISAATQRAPVIIRNPSSIRPWQHVLDPLNGYLMLAQALYGDDDEYSGSWNFGPVAEDSREVSWVANRLSHKLGNTSSWRVSPEHQQEHHEAINLKLDISKSKMKLGWKPVLSLEEAIAMVADWQINWLKNGNGYQCCLDQISDFKNRITLRNNVEEFEGNLGSS